MTMEVTYSFHITKTHVPLTKKIKKEEDGFDKWEYSKIRGEQIKFEV